eukprot:CAMPEP_0194283748 /NCGR_PEP_ID=MMETSP0169-20130528/26060_1 /TAXON_ID=218684 /ORGANISM="Corethron pennatum, Strain L29A3" /LENGTH=100 /DNA_ID=CAMNT_0039029415 /DNA_START=87 /DNA_END=389 /DNA_ORIENTATION=-
MKSSASRKKRSVKKSARGSNSGKNNNESRARNDFLNSFELFDDDGKGTISFKDLKRVAQELGEDMTDIEIKEMINEADLDGDGEINPDEFLRILEKTKLA